MIIICQPQICSSLWLHWLTILCLTGFIFETEKKNTKVGMCTAFLCRIEPLNISDFTINLMEHFDIIQLNLLLP